MLLQNVLFCDSVLLQIGCGLSGPWQCNPNISILTVLRDLMKTCTIDLCLTNVLSKCTMWLLNLHRLFCFESTLSCCLSQQWIGQNTNWMSSDALPTTETNKTMLSCDFFSGSSRNTKSCKWDMNDPTWDCFYKKMHAKLQQWPWLTHSLLKSKRKHIAKQMWDCTVNNALLLTDCHFSMQNNWRAWSQTSHIFCFLLELSWAMTFQFVWHLQQCRIYPNATSFFFPSAAEMQSWSS